MTERCCGAPPQFPTVPIVQPAVDTVPPTREASPAVVVPLKTPTGWVLSITAAAEAAPDAEGVAEDSGPSDAGPVGDGLEGSELDGSGLEGAGVEAVGPGDAAAVLPPCPAETAMVSLAEENPSEGSSRKATRPTANDAAPAARMEPRRRPRRDSPADR